MSDHLFPTPGLVIGTTQNDDGSFQWGVGVVDVTNETTMFLRSIETYLTQEEAVKVAMKTMKAVQKLLSTPSEFVELDAPTSLGDPLPD